MQLVTSFDMALLLVRPLHVLWRRTGAQLAMPSPVEGRRIAIEKDDLRESALKRLIFRENLITRFSCFSVSRLFL